ncbi:2-dehydro-3-deoxygalactonokinase, partial [Methylobrevis pamukkalensis]|uniref:2-dehydro-3-deoxygalactonokinase n=1 Tax=Methylobrevis pamukkalensis TaxID=1439726 RepID=UPI00114CA654
LDVRILPGLASRSPAAPDVMRGEETQLLGMTRLVATPSATVCMPGTHSKWVDIDGGVVTGFSTRMTGELFALFSRHSILRLSLGADPAPPAPTDPDFLGGVADGLHAGAATLSRLFGLRAAGLLQGLGSQAAAARLSGLLIGAEVGEMAGRAGRRPLVMLASGTLAALYAAAFAAPATTSSPSMPTRRSAPASGRPPPRSGRTAKGQDHDRRAADR